MSNAADFDRVDQLRAESDAVMVGASTVRRDDPRLLVRSEERRMLRLASGLPSSPVKVTVTCSGDLPATSAFFCAGDVEKLVYCPRGDRDAGAQRARRCRHGHRAGRAGHDARGRRRPGRAGRAPPHDRGRRAGAHPVPDRQPRRRAAARDRTVLRRRVPRAAVRGRRPLSRGPPRVARSSPRPAGSATSCCCATPSRIGSMRRVADSSPWDALTRVRDAAGARRGGDAVSGPPRRTHPGR